MPYPLKSPADIKSIVSSFKEVFTTNDVSHLTKSAYYFIRLANGFVAHYNLFGFKEEYRDVSSLKSDIIRFKEQNQWDNFEPGDENHDYHMQQKEIYNLICENV